MLPQEQTHTLMFSSSCANPVAYYPLSVFKEPTIFVNSGFGYSLTFECVFNPISRAPWLPGLVIQRTHPSPRVTTPISSSQPRCLFVNENTKSPMLAYLTHLCLFYSFHRPHSLGHVLKFTHFLLVVTPHER